MPSVGSSSLHSLPSTHVLCESCGYDIHAQVNQMDELALRSGICPECAESLARSVPWLKPGSSLERTGAWRANSMGLGDGFRLHTQFMRHARNNMRSIRGDASEELLGRVLTTASVVASVTLSMGFMATATLSTSWSGFFVALGAVTVFGLCGVFIVFSIIFTIYLGLTTLESHGMRAIARTRAWRITAANSKAITSHASIGWLLGAYAGLATSLMTFVLCVLIWMFEASDSAKVAMALAHFAAGPLVTSLGGLLAFEWLCWVGMRERKFTADLKAPGDRPSAP